jgi:hypothetical protein
VAVIARGDHGWERKSQRLRELRERIVTASEDGTARIWSAAGGLSITLKHQDPISAATRIWGRAGLLQAGARRRQGSIVQPGRDTGRHRKHGQDRARLGRHDGKAGHATAGA